MAKLQLVFLEEVYYLRCDGEESQAEIYGQPLDWTARDGRRYLALVDLKERTDDVESLLDEWVYCVSEAPDVEIIEDEEEDEGDEEGGEGTEVDVEEDDHEGAHVH